MAFQSLARNPQPFWGAILIGTRPSPALLEATGPDRLPPLFLMAGGEEPAAAANRLAAKALERDGFRVKLTIYPGVGHSFPPTWEGELRRALNYFAKAQGEGSSGPADPAPGVGDLDLGGPRPRSKPRQTAADQETQ
jgi:predicted esterase